MANNLTSQTRRERPQRTGQNLARTAEKMRPRTPQKEAIARPQSTQGGGQMLQGPMGGGKGLQSLAQSLGNLAPSLQQYQQNMAQADMYTAKAEREEGYMSAFQGKEKPDDATENFLEGYEKFKGESAKADFQARMQEFYQENYTASPEEWQQKKDALIQEFVADKSKAWAKGFLPEAKKVENRYDNSYVKAQGELLKNELITDVRKRIDTNVQNTLDSANEIDDPDKRADTIAKNLRQELTGLQKQAKQLNLDRNTVSQEFVNKIGAIAEETGRPELLQFATEKDSDGGTKLTDTPVRDNVRKWKKRAEVTQRRMRNNYEELKNEAEEKAKRKLERDIVTTLDQMDSTNTQGLIKAQQQLRGEYSQILNPNDLENYLGVVDDMLDKRGFADTDNPEVRMNLENLAKNGNLSRGILRNVRGQITSDTYWDLYKTNVEEIEELEDRQRKKQKSRANDIKTTYAKQYGQSSIPGTDSLDWNAPKRQAYAENRINGFIDEYRERNNGTYPSQKELRDYADSIEKEVYSMYPFQTGSGETVSKEEIEDDTNSSSEGILKKIDEVDKRKQQQNSSLNFDIDTGTRQNPNE